MIGLSYTDAEGRTWRVTGYWDLNQQYVLVFDGYQEGLRRASDVRRRLELDAEVKA